MLNVSDEHVIFDDVTLTAAYAGNASSNIEVQSNDKFTIIAEYTGGATETSNTCELEISFSADGTTWAQYGTWSSGATSTFTAVTFQFDQDTNVPINFEGLGEWLRIRAKETGVVSNFGTLKLTLYRNKN